MADKKTYTVHRSIHGDGKDYRRGDTRHMTEVEAAPLVATGALALKGEVPMERGPAVEHLFGRGKASAPDYVPATTDKIISDAAASDAGAGDAGAGDAGDSPAKGRTAAKRG